MAYKVTKFSLGKVYKGLTFIPKTPRGKFIYGTATASSVYIMNDDQYEALEGIFIHPGSTNDFASTIRNYYTTDIGLAGSAYNYLSGDYGRTILVHVGLTAVTILPMALLGVSSVRNTKAVTSSVELLRKFGTNVSNLKFSEFWVLFSTSATATQKAGFMAGRVPMSLRQKFMRDFEAYFKKFTSKGKAAKANGSNSIHSRMAGLPGNTSTLSKITNVALRKDALALESVMALFLAMWLAENAEADGSTDQDIAENDMKKLDIKINDTYNFFHANTLLGGDIHAIKTCMHVDYTTAKHIFITYIRTGVRLIGVWLSLSEMDRLRFHRLLLLQFNGIYDILQGRTQSTTMNVTMLDSALRAMEEGNLANLVSVLALQRVMDPLSKKAMFSGSDKSVTFRYLFYFIGDNEQIKELYADGAAITAVQVVQKPRNEASETQETSRTNSNSSTTIDENAAPVMEDVDPNAMPIVTEKAANVNTPGTAHASKGDTNNGSHNFKITDDMLADINSLVKSSANG